MTLQQYVKDATATESLLTKPINVDIQRFLTLLNLFIATGNLLDVIKKDTFYGLPTDLVKLEMRKQRIIDNEARIEAAAIQIITQPGNNPQSLTNVDSRLTHAIIGMSTEAVELCEALVASINSGNPIDNVNVCEEMFDAMWYILIGHDAMDVDPNQTLERGFNKLRLRYPDKFRHDQAHNRDITAERSVLEGK